MLSPLEPHLIPEKDKLVTLLPRRFSRWSTPVLIATALTITLPQTAVAEHQGPGRGHTHPADIQAVEVPCNSGPPEPIQLRVQDGGDICFGGSPGVESVALTIAFMDSGDYKGNIFIQRNNQCVIQSFRPRRAIAVNAIVCAIEITEPPRGRGNRQ
jgi:hypothetical protein